MGTQLPLPQRGTVLTQFSAHICCGQMAGLHGSRCHLVIWYGARPQPRRLCVRWRPHSILPPKKGQSPRSPIFGPFLLWPNSCLHQDATWYGGRPQPRGLCGRWGPSPLPNFQPMFIIVSLISLEHCTVHIIIGFFKFISSFSILSILFLEKV